MGGLRTRMPFTFWTYVIGALALAGIAPLAGFFSKDEILLEASILKPGVYILLVVAAFLTAFYMGRQLLMVFFGKPRSEPAVAADESPPVMTIPLIVLAACTVLGGLLNFPSLLTLEHWLEETYRAVGVEVVSHLFSIAVALISTLVAITALAAAFAWFFYGRKIIEKGQDDPLHRVLGPIYVAMENKWYVDEAYHFLFVNPYLKISAFTANVIDWEFWHDWFHDKVLARGFMVLSQLLSVRIDLGIIDRFANGLGSATQSLSGRMRRIQTGFVRNYALSIFLGVVIIIGYLIFR